MKHQGNASVWVVIALLVVAGVLLFVFSGEDADTGDSATTTDDQATTTSTASGDSLAQIQAALSGDGAVECTFEAGMDSAEGQTATSYIKGGEMRTIAETDTITSNMIFSDDQVYVWEEGASQGITFNAENMAGDFDQMQAPVRPDDVTEAVASENITCEVSTVDDSLFVIPEDVTFMDSFSSPGANPNPEEAPQQ